MQVTAKGFVLVQTKEVSMRPEDVSRVFQNSAEDLADWTAKGQRRLPSYHNVSFLMGVMIGVWVCLFVYLFVLQTRGCF